MFSPPCHEFLSNLPVVDPTKNIFSDILLTTFQDVAFHNNRTDVVLDDTLTLIYFIPELFLLLEISINNVRKHQKIE
jgi:hypothetical protein